MATDGSRRLLRKALRWLLTVAVVAVVGYFFAATLARNWDDVQAAQIGFDWTWVVATLVFAAAVLVTGLLWGRLLRRLDGTRITRTEAMAVQSLSWLLKYIPGQVGSVVNKVLWAGKRGISRTVVIISFVYENVLLQLASIIPSVLILLLALGTDLFGENPATLLLPLLALIPLGLVMWKPFFHRVVNVAARRALKSEVPVEYFLSTPQTLASLAEFLLPRLLNAVGFVILAATVTEVTPAEWLPFGAAYVLAGAIGILAFFVPSGLGVREAIIVLILSQYTTTAQAIVISLLARLLSTIGDAVVALAYLALRRAIPKENRP
ncbi:hypothetical protein ARHIZOSPH14_03330 [Agromyces rhizosphaerae]|uniref:Flippase-like domain-containing protein n=1 Tax=Agromyces rhizosphaerae TaxID=88374 RepID=A0A9W6CU37_9MICO|nr:lysylphosphatidylglycerol synthase domain-containing protein [Agromyces rhizosphaerae]GLI26091.1 hypothetical protein ARHIZOSPH14_03330 [Agromyces rhizosphaerae]